MIWVKFIKKLLQALQSGNSPKQLAVGFVLGMLMGITPFWSLHNVMILMMLIILNVNVSMFLLASLIFSLAGYVLDPVFHNLGYFLLSTDSIKPFWIFCTETPVLSFFRLNNTTNLGSIISSFIMLIPVYYFTVKFVNTYRTKFAVKIGKWRIVKIIKSTKLYSIYQLIKPGNM